jgi:hypothetical protein
VKQPPATPLVVDAPDVLEGHLWVQELVVGGPLRFQVDDRGMVFGGPERVFDRWDEPLPYAAAVRHVREEFDAARFRDLVDDPADYTFFGVSTHAAGVTYDWDRLPPFLGTDVWSDDNGFLPPDRVEHAFDNLGLDPVNTVQKELPSRDFDPDRYEVPESAWYDGPAAGVVVRNKRGGRTKRANPGVSQERVEPVDADAAALAEQHAITARITAVADDLESEGREVRVDALVDRIVETVGRELGARLADSDVDESELRSAVAERVARELGR